MIVSADDGLDEITTTTITRAVELREDGSLHYTTIDPADFDIKYTELDALIGGDALINAAILTDILNGIEGPKLDIACLNAGAALYVAGAMSLVTRYAARRAPTWGCGGELTARTEYTATAFSKPLMMIFRAVYRPTREVEALAKVSPYFPQEVRYHVTIEPTFERYVYGPLTETVLRAAERLKILQAGSLHAYLGYVIVLVLSLVLMVWWTR